MAKIHESLLPVFDTSDESAVLVHADATTTWNALLATDLLEVGRSHKMVGGLSILRALPQIAAGLAHGELPEKMPDSMRLGDMTDDASGDGTWVRLGAKPNEEIAFGLVGKFWKPVIEYTAVPADEFASFSEPGWAKTIYAFTFTPVEGGTLLTSVMRTATTDEHARNWFRRYWTYGVGSGAHILAAGMIESAREAAESAD